LSVFLTQNSIILFSDFQNFSVKVNVKPFVFLQFPRTHPLITNKFFCQHKRQNKSITVVSIWFEHRKQFFILFLIKLKLEAAFNSIYKYENGKLSWFYFQHERKKQQRKEIFVLLRLKTSNKMLNMFRIHRMIIFFKHEEVKLHILTSYFQLNSLNCYELWTLGKKYTRNMSIRVVFLWCIIFREGRCRGAVLTLDIMTWNRFLRYTLAI